MSGANIDLPPPPTVMVPETKRGRGRPRKQRDTVEEGELKYIINLFLNAKNYSRSDWGFCSFPY